MWAEPPGQIPPEDRVEVRYKLKKLGCIKLGSCENIVTGDTSVGMLLSSLSRSKITSYSLGE